MDYKIYSFSPYNRKANQYYNNKHRLDQLERRLLGLQQSSAKINPDELLKLKKESDDLKPLVHENLRAAKMEENQLQNKLSMKQNGGLSTSSQIQGQTIDYFA